MRHPRGHAFFAHLLLPHYPYVFDERCELRSSTSDWLTNRISSTDVLIYNTPDSRAQKYERYAEQTRCLLTLLDGLLDGLESRGLLDDAIIVVHGDHVYMSDQLSVKRIPKAGGPVETLASRELPCILRSLRVANGVLYWLDDDGEKTLLRSLPLGAP